MSQAGSDNSDLERKLAALAEDGTVQADGSRLLVQSGLPRPLQAILKEIDETVLAQDLAFAFGEAGTLTLAASGRRLLGVRAIEGLALPAVADQFLGRGLQGADDTALKALLPVLAQLDVIDGPLTVTTMPGAPFGGHSDAGLSVARLAEKLSVDYPFKPPSALDRFRAHLRPAPEAWALARPEGTARTKVAGQSLGLFAEQARSKAKGTAVAPSLTILGQNSGDAACYGVLVVDGIAFAWAFDPQHTAFATVAFYDIFPA